ncbi:MAG: KpsF/GutQ family sugar-phosphate isomerase [candidate division Zixibacteria bacterium]|nr:KpsF/GutQ family sugar-phosphate isomerase [candidate division Zixibacteria bacterium]MBU1472051.1 KpsF/GutQ family sugar-phosphate isomerase [candidate division Zixibacteria bacterium]MBU2626359.1 KpsF/GutQ family sugar-phosphate isomerase [candidate division Zixibacteria bacterium]
MSRKKRAAEVIRSQAEQVARLAARLDDSFDRALDTLFECKGRVIVTGMGKSGIIARKITGTFNSTGTPSLYLHPSEGMHGDLGIVTPDDVVLVLSKSGDTDELSLLIPPFKRLGVPVIAIVGDMKSPLAEKADIVLDASVESEADEFNLVPTTSSTAALVLGDALAVVLLEMRGFSPEDFALRHPGGALGRRLLLRVSDLMHTGDDMPVVKGSTMIREAIIEITSKRLGLALVVDDSGKFAGIYTDGDLRRTVEKGNDFLTKPISKYMSRNPKTISADALVEQALSIMEKHSITSLAVLDADRHPIGVIHLHDILRRKVV